MRTHSNRLRLEALEDRYVPTVIVLGDTMSIIGTAGADVIRVRDDGMGNITGLDNANFFSASGIKTININTENGDDNVYYDLTGDMGVDQQRWVVVGLGSVNGINGGGNDNFFADLHDYDLKSHSLLSFTADGGGGHDQLYMTAGSGIGAVNVESLASLKTHFGGNDGDDTIIQRYRGVNRGFVTMRSLGGNENDTVRQHMTALAGSTGPTTAVVKGEAGNDVLSVFLYLPAGQMPGGGTTVEGGVGHDIANVTFNMVGYVKPDVEQVFFF